MNNKIWLTYDDVALVPQCNNIDSRTEPSLKTWLTKNIEIDIPLIPSNMDTVIGDNLADIIIANGGIPIFHRFCSFEQKQIWVRKYKNKCFISCGLGDKHFNESIKLLKLGALGTTIDIAHGHTLSVMNLIRKFKKECPDKDIIAGNVCTAMGYQDLVNAGADAVKVGVGPGSACSTRIVTGFGTPQFTAVKECGEIAKKLRVPIIADGGIKHPKDIALALAAGASTVMMGKIFSKTLESAAPKTEKNNKIYVGYRGQASREFQEEYYGSVKTGTIPEGISFNTLCSGNAQSIIDYYCGSLRSSFTYGGARNMKEFQRKAEFVRVSSTYATESHPRHY